VLFDKICRKNGIAHRLAAPASPNQKPSGGCILHLFGSVREEFSFGLVRSA
jgi:hypothetical protein